MQQETFRSHVDGRLYRRINKTTARKAHDNGKTIFMQSCNISFDSMWQSACPIPPGCHNELRFGGERISIL